MQFLIFTVIILALVFDFINGFHDTANAIATSVNTRAIRPNHAVIMAASMNFIGAMVSTGVAKTIGGDIVSSPGVVDEKIIIAALIGAITWNLLTWYFGIPSSSSHALIGGLIGAVLISVGMSGLNWNGIGKIFLALVASPAIALVTGIVIMNIIFRVFDGFNPHVLNDRFRKMQLLSAAAIAFSNGSNDAQKSMGIITLALFSGGFIAEFLRGVNGLGHGVGRLANNQNRRRENFQAGTSERFCGGFEFVNGRFWRDAFAFARFHDARCQRLNHGRRHGEES